MVDTAGTYRELAERFGLEEEIAGGGCTILSRYLPNGAHVWATCEDGGGLPTSDDWLVCAYPAGGDGDEVTFEAGSDRGGAPDLLTALNAALEVAERGHADFGKLVVEFAEFRARHNLPEQSAEDLAADPANVGLLGALVDFSERWETLERGMGERPDLTPPAIEADAPQWQREFGAHFDACPWPAVPHGFEDISWHNDACPRLWSEAESVAIWCESPDPTKRENGPDAPRYVLTWERDSSAMGDPVDFHTIAEGDAWADILHALHAHRIALRFSELLHADLGADTMARIVATNAANGLPNVCASHDHCDANMPMADAFKAVTGLDVEPCRTAHCLLWNRAWDMAKARGFAIDEEPESADEGAPDEAEERLARFREGRATVADAQAMLAEEMEAGRPCGDTIAALQGIIARGGDVPGKSVLALFAERFPDVSVGADIAAGLALCPVASTCGDECAKAIEAAGVLAFALRTAHGADTQRTERIARYALEACATFYFG